MAIKKEPKLSKDEVVKGLTLVIGASYTGVDGVVRRKGTAFPLTGETEGLLTAVDENGVPYFKEVEISPNPVPVAEDDDLDEDLTGAEGHVTV